MIERRRRKCLTCGQLFRPDPRKLRYPRYCSTPACRKASKAASQVRWPNPRTGPASAAPSMWPGCGPGGQPTRAMRDGDRVRY